ncbi:MAG: hypothetical protein ACHRHE_17410 [Tepidisphaerales bacterium]
MNINEPYTSRLARLDPEIAQKFALARAEYYRQVDWALDIRDAYVMGLRIRGVPVHLIRRDPETQAVVSREQIVERRWASLDIGKSWWKPILEAEATRPGGDIVLVAPRLDESFDEQMEGIRRLRSAGISNPD